MGGQGEEKTYQLIQVPSADAHVTLVLIHTLAEVADISLTGGVLPSSVGGIALVQTVVHGLALGRSLLLGLSGGARATTAEHATDSVADGGTDSDTTKEERVLVKLCVSGRVPTMFPEDGRGMKRNTAGKEEPVRGEIVTYAAVEAIWPKRPGPALC